MKGIMFNTKYGLEQAVLRGDKTRTWRADKKPRYEVGEIVAIKQCYHDVTFNRQHSEELGLISEYGDVLAEILFSKGYDNKMFVKNELMPHQIHITSVKQCRLQDLTNEECLREGVCKDTYYKNTYYNVVGIYLKGHPGVLHPFKSPKDAFFMLINRLYGWAYWYKNPMGYAYEFELVK